MSRTISLKNETASQIHISRLQGNCSCAELILVQDGISVNQATVMPGKRIQIRISLISSKLSGTFQKQIMAFSGDSGLPVAVVNLTGTVRPIIQFSPNLIQFGVLRQPTTKTVRLSVWIDAEITATVKPELRSTSEFVKPRLSRDPLPESKAGSPGFRFDYDVTLDKHTPAGPLSGALTFAPEVIRTDIQSALAGITATFFADVQGELSAIPNLLLIGTEKQGQAMPHRLTIKASSQHLLAGLTANSANGDLRIVMGKTTKTGDVFQRSVDVSAVSSVKQGPLQSSIIFTAGEGITLSVAVIGHITP